MKTPLLEYVPLEEDEEKGTVTNTTTTPQEEEEDETDPEFIDYMKRSRETYWNNKRNRYRDTSILCTVIALYVVISTMHFLKKADSLCTNERGQTLFSGQPYTIYATGNNDTVYFPTAITVPSEEHCTYLKQCSNNFANVLCFVKPSYVKMLWTLDIEEEEEEDAGTLPPINQYNAGL
jgi:hypothetical protein